MAVGVYTLSVPDWKEARRTTDIYLVRWPGEWPPPPDDLTRDKNETGPRVEPGRRLLRVQLQPGRTGRRGDRATVPDAAGRREAMRLTDAKDGVANFAFSRTGRGWSMPPARRTSGSSGPAVAGIDSARPKQLTRHATRSGVTIAPDSRRIYFTAPDTLDQDNRTGSRRSSR